MKKRVNNDESNICKTIIMDYLVKECGIKETEAYLRDNYRDYIVDNFECFEIVNEFYVDEDKLEEFQSNIKNEETKYDYVINNIEYLVTTDIGNKKYIPVINDNDPDIDNLVENGTLAIKMNRLINYAQDMKERITKTREIDKYVKGFEKELSNKLNLKVRILFNDIVILDKSEL